MRRAMRLWDHPFSPYSQKVRIALREKWLEFVREIPDGIASGVDLGYSARNPRLEVPALEVGDQMIFDSTIIIEYLEDSFPEVPLRAPDPMQRARARMVEDICDTHYEAINWGLGEIRFFGRGNEIAGKLRANAGAEISAIQSWLEVQLSPSGWFNGDAFGQGDVAAVPFVAMSQILGFSPQPESRLNGWLERVMQRPAVAQTMGEAAKAAAGMDRHSRLLEAGNFRRQFRDHRLEWLLRSGGMAVLVEGMAKRTVRFNDLELFRQ